MTRFPSLPSSCFVQRVSILGILGIFFCALQSGQADLGESREQIIARYGKLDESYENTSTHTYLDKSGSNLVSEPQTYTILRFSSKDAPGSVALSREGKSVEEVYGWTEDVGQKRIMEILLRYSKGHPWRATKLDYPDTEMVWRYTEPETRMHAAYERRNTDDLNRVYYGLSITP